MSSVVVLQKTYHGFEDAVDIERDISEMWSDSEIPSEFQGEVQVLVIYKLTDQEDALNELFQQIDGTKAP